MTKAALKGIDPARFVGEVRLDIHAAEFLAAGNWDAAVALVSNAIFRKLENERNTKDLVRKASVRLGLQIDQGKLDAAMPYLDARHMLVHRDGKTDEQYRRDYPGIPLDGEKLIIDYGIAHVHCRLPLEPRLEGLRHAKKSELARLYATYHVHTASILVKNLSLVVP